MRSLATYLTIAGIAYLGAMFALALSKAPLGSPLFFVLTSIAVCIYAATMWRLRGDAPIRRGLFFSALAFAVLFRAPLAVQPVNPDNDMIRYLWDGRIQHLGINPYLVLPADAELQWTHTPETRNMP